MNACIRATWIGTTIVALTILLSSSARGDDRLGVLLDEVDDLWRGRSSHASIQMEVKTAHYTRNMRMKVWSKGKELSLVRIQAPLKERGTATLKSNNDIYTYLPKTDQTIRLTSGMMMGAWMGSHFTNDDLVKESRLLDDYDARLLSEAKERGHILWTIELLPKPDAAVVWGKVILTIRYEDRIPVEYRYYDEDGKLIRTMSFSGIREVEGRPRPMQLRVVPSEKPTEYTQVTYSDIEFDIDIKDGFFSLSRLRRR